MNEERRRMVTVTDKSAEASIKLNNVLTFLVLGVMSWVGWNIQEMRKDINESQVERAVLQRDIVYLRKQLDTHVADRELHNHKEHSGGS